MSHARWGRNIEIGCSPDNPFEGRLKHKTFRHPDCSMLSATSSGCGNSLFPTWIWLGWRTVATVLWYGFLNLLRIIANSYLLSLVWKEGIDGYFYIDQLGRIQFRLFHLIPIKCWYSCQLSRLSSIFFSSGMLCMEVLGVNMYQSLLCPYLQILVGISRSQRVPFLVAFSFPNVVFSGVYLFQTVTISSDSSPSEVAYGELSQFVRCLLQKIRTSGSLPLLEKWEKYIFPNHSAFAATKEEHFLVGTRFDVALEKMPSSYLKKRVPEQCASLPWGIC